MTLEEFKQKQAALKAQQDALSENVKDLIIAGSQQFFEQNPHVKSYSWKQYTPYFNDGDVCEFSAHIDYLTIMAEKDGVSVLLEETMDYDEFNTLQEPLVTMLSSFDADSLKNLFGDHAEVTVTREGIEVDECHHE